MDTGLPELPTFYSWHIGKSASSGQTLLSIRFLRVFRVMYSPLYGDLSIDYIRETADNLYEYFTKKKENDVLKKEQEFRKYSVTLLSSKLPKLSSGYRWVFTRNSEDYGKISIYRDRKFICGSDGLNISMIADVLFNNPEEAMIILGEFDYSIDHCSRNYVSFSVNVVYNQYLLQTDSFGLSGNHRRDVVPFDVKIKVSKGFFVVSVPGVLQFKKYLRDLSYEENFSEEVVWNSIDESLEYHYDIFKKQQEKEKFYGSYPPRSLKEFEK